MPDCSADVNVASMDGLSAFNSPPWPSLEERRYEAARRLKEASEAGLSRQEVQAVKTGLVCIIQNLQPDAECRT